MFQIFIVPFDAADCARASAPNIILLEPVVRLDQALYPIAVLLELVILQVAFISRASSHSATLRVPRKCISGAVLAHVHISKRLSGKVVPIPTFPQPVIA